MPASQTCHAAAVAAWTAEHRKLWPAVERSDLPVGQQSNPEYVASAFKESAECLNLVARVRAQTAEDIAQAIEALTGRAVCEWTRTEAAAAARDHAGQPAESVVAAPARSACPQCAEHGTPARVDACGPACHEAHTYIAPCERSR
jgi:hypothetical protein